MAVGLEPNPAVQAGAAVEPLVTSADTSIVGPQAVQQLVDAYHGGVVSADDIINRIGEVGQANKKALLEQLGEYVSPQAIQARMSAQKAAVAQNTLATQQATGAQALVEPQLNLTQTQLAAQQAAAVYGQGGLDTYQTFGHLYGEALPPTPTEDDFKKAAQRGNEMRGQLMLADQWFKQITPAGDRVIEDAKGNKYPRKVNWQGIDVTPPNPSTGYPGSPAYKAYARQLNEVLPQFDPRRTQIFPKDSIAPSPDDVTDQEPPGTVQPPSGPVVEPLTPDQVRAQAVEKLGVTPAQAANMRPQDIVAARQLLSPAVNPPPTPSAPASAAVQPAFSGQGPAPGEVPTVPGQTTQDARKALQELPGVKKFAEAQPIYGNFLSAAIEAKKTPPGEATGVSDLKLGESYGKLLDPSATLREFKWDAIKKAIPWADEFKDAKNIILRTHTFPPAFKDRLINDGFETIEASEKPLIAKMQYAEQQNPGVLDTDEKALAAGVPYRQRMGYYQAIGQPSPGSVPSAGAPAAGTKRTVNLPGIGPVVVNY